MTSTAPSPSRRTLAVLAASALVPLLAVLGDPLHRIPGGLRTDLPKHVWSYWHTLTHLSTWPHTTALGGPTGGVFLDVMLLPSIAMAPVAATLGPVAAANTWVWLSLLLVGATTAALARRLVGSERAACTAGLVAQAAPFLAGYPLASGVHERLAIWVFPLVLLGLLEWRDRGRARGLAWAAVGLFFATMGCQVYGVFTLALLGLALPVWWPGLRRLPPVALAVGAPLVAAWAVVRGPTVADDALVPQAGRLDLWPGPPGDLPGVDLSLRDLLDPTWVAQLVPATDGDELHVLVYLCWTVLAAALAGARLSRGPVAWLVGVGLVLASLALGPTLRVGPWLTWNPAHVTLSWTLPVFRTIPVPWQAVGAAVPLLAVGVGALADRWRWPPGAAVLVGLVVLERAIVLPVDLVLPATTIDTPAVYDRVSGPVVEVPRVVGDTALTPGEVFLAQMSHGQPLAISINAGTTPLDHHLPTLRGVSSHWPHAAACWSELGFGTVVVHRDRVSASVDPRALVDGITRAVGAPVADDGVRAVFRLTPAEPPTPTFRPDMVEALLDAGLVGGPPPRLPHPSEACPR